MASQNPVVSDPLREAPTNDPKMLAPGVYWCLESGIKPLICEKRESENFVRFTNGSHLSWPRESARFLGPLPVPKHDFLGDV